MVLIMKDEKFLATYEIIIENFIQSKSHILEFLLFLQRNLYRPAKNACLLYSFCQIIWMEKAYHFKQSSEIIYLLHNLLYISAKYNDK